ncbi:MAG: alkaline phosphatase family protein, partial [Actinomycetota bacterium]|nr:alkaline phosphatase family protein [Actinomycetota bacterium]
RACGLAPELVTRIARGHHPVRSEDITIVPREPNFVGTFDLTSHSGPWDYLQEVPLVLYGPGVIPARGDVNDPVDHTSIFPTVGTLADVSLPETSATSLLRPEERGTTPRVIVVIVWDGAGRATLERWPDAWPTLRRLGAEGMNFPAATVGSSPSVTSAVHSTMATGRFPGRHGITGNELRRPSGELEPTFAGLQTQRLEVPTFADVVDERLDNLPKVGLLGWTRWHLGLLGHGASRPGGDRDELALIHQEGSGASVHGNEDVYELPSGLEDAASIEQLIRAVDRADGEVDGLWLGHDITLSPDNQSWTTYSNPAWARYQARLAVAMMERGGYGTDAVPDLFLTNFKMTDLAGHRWGIDAPEMRAVVTAQDEALAEIVAFLDNRIGDYALFVTSDHGASRLAEQSGAWPIAQSQLIDDVNAHFDVASSESLIESSAAFGFYLDREVAESLDVTAEDVSLFLNGYTIRENWAARSLPRGYTDRGNETVLEAAWPSDLIGDVSRCSKS